MSSSQLFFHLLQCHPLFRQHDEGVVEQICRFFDEALFVLPFRGDDDFDGFFADFLDDAIFSAGEEAGGVGAFGEVGFAGLDEVGEFVKHGCFSKTSD